MAQVRDDVALARAILSKDRKAAADLVALHSDAVHAYVWRRLTPQTEAVDDLVQEVFLAAWRGLPAYSGTSSLRSWILGIARNKVEDHYRAVLRVALDSTDEDGAGDELVADVDLEESLDSARLADRTQGILAGLRQDYRVLLRWRYWEKRSLGEMATASGQSEKAIERRLARARDRFRDAWNAQFGREVPGGE